MLRFYDLHDLYRIFVNIRCVPDYELNGEILVKIIDVMKQSGTDKFEENQFRTALSSIPLLDKVFYEFAFVQNIYSCPSFSPLKDQTIYDILIESCESLLKAFNEKDYKKVDALADCLHNLPIYIAENKYAIPKNFWKYDVKYYRKNYDNNFLRNTSKL